MVQSDRYPALQRLLAQGKTTLQAGSLAAFACTEAGVPASGTGEAGDPLPLAAISWLGELAPPAVDSEAGFFLLADPVSLVLQRDALYLAEPVPLPLTAEETAGFQAALNVHFADDGLRFLCAPSGHWYLHLPRLPRVRTFSPAQVVNCNVHDYLPQGEDGARWRHLLNEIQMLLFSHPLNQAREMAGLPPFNSLWIWGEGALPAQPLDWPVVVHAVSPLPRGLARLAQVPVRQVPAACAEMEAGTAHWVFFDVDCPLTDSWIETAVTALRRGVIQSLRISMELNARLLHLDLRRRDLWKFWCKPAPLITSFKDVN